MNLKQVLDELFEYDGLMTLLLLTRDGLPVEMLGHGLRADQLAAEVAGVAERARSSSDVLGLGEPTHLAMAVRDYSVVTFPLGEHYLTAVIERSLEPEVVPFIYEHTLEPLQNLLGGGG